MLLKFQLASKVNSKVFARVKVTFMNILMLWQLLLTI